MLRKTKDESGFTLIELMTIIAIIGVLSATSIQSIAVYRERAYNAQSDSLIRNAITAIESSKIEEGQFGPFDWAFAWSSSPGPVPTWGGGGNIVPGLMNGPNTQIWISYDSWCENFQPNSAWCMVDFIWVYNCKNGYSKMWYRTTDGSTTEDSWGPAFWGGAC